MQNTFIIDADLKKESYYNEPKVTANDDITFVVNITDDGLPFDLTDVVTFTLANTRGDKTTIVTSGIKTGLNQVTFVLGTNETAISGKVKAVVQLYGADERVSTLSFSYKVDKDPTGDGYIPSESEQTLIQTVLGDGPLIIQEAQTAADYANTQGDYALQVAVDNETRFLNAVSSVALRDSTYPTPAHGDTVRVTETATSYRYVNGEGWVITDVYNPTAIDEVTALLVETDKKLPKFERQLLFNPNKIPVSGNVYNAFASGAVINGKEVHVFRSAHEHLTNPNLGFGVLVAVIKELDGTFTQKTLNLDYSIMEYRDPNIVVNKNGNVLLLSAAGYDGTSYKNYVWNLDANLNVTSTTHVTTMNGYFGWGNTLYSEGGKLLKVGYLQNNTGGVFLFYNNTQIIEIFPTGTNNPTEATISQWGDKLICISRQNNGNAVYRETYDLEGLTGWSPIKTLTFQVHAPCLPPYVAIDEPLMLTYSQIVGGSSPIRRNVKISASFDGDLWSIERSLTSHTGIGGYNSFVKNENGYGMLWYEDVSGGTNVYYADVSLDKYLNDIPYRESQRKQKDINLAFQKGNGVEQREIIKVINIKATVTGNGTNQVDFAIDLTPFKITSTNPDAINIMSITPVSANFAAIFDVRVKVISNTQITGTVSTYKDTNFSSNVDVHCTLLYSRPRYGSY